MYSVRYVVYTTAQDYYYHAAVPLNGTDRAVRRSFRANPKVPYLMFHSFTFHMAASHLSSPLDDPSGRVTHVAF